MNRLRSATRCALIADAQGIADYYRQEFGATTDLIAYGAPILPGCNVDLLGDDLQFKRFHVIVARFEPENHVAGEFSDNARSDSTYPLLVVGGAPFAEEYTQRVQKIADSDPRIRMLGPVWDQDRLDALYSGALTYIHGHSVGGTNPPPARYGRRDRNSPTTSVSTARFLAMTAASLPTQTNSLPVLMPRKQPQTK